MLVKLNKLNHMSYHDPPVLWMITNGILVMEFFFNVPNDVSPLLATCALENNAFASPSKKTNKEEKETKSWSKLRRLRSGPPSFSSQVGFIYWFEPLKVSHHYASFGCHRHCGSGHIMELTCHLISQHHAIKFSYGFMHRSQLR